MVSPATAHPAEHEASATVASSRSTMEARERGKLREDTEPIARYANCAFRHKAQRRVSLRVHTCALRSSAHRCRQRPSLAAPRYSARHATDGPMHTPVVPTLTLALVLGSCTPGTSTKQPLAVIKDQGTTHAAHRTAVEPQVEDEWNASPPLDASVPGDASLDTSSSSPADSDVFAACTEDSDCVLVTGSCHGPMAAHRSEAARVDAENRRLLSMTRCSGRATARPVRAVCAPPRCVLEPMDHPEWRWCERTRECVAVFRNCQHWQSIHRRFTREANAAMRLNQSCGTIAIPPPPRIECRYGWCVTAWEGP